LLWRAAIDISIPLRAEGFTILPFLIAIYVSGPSRQYKLLVLLSRHC